MGRSNMFDLEQSITEWRQQMLAAGIKTPVPLEELEIHLREEIGRRMKTGVDESRAFKIAAQQIGPPDALKREFKNVLEVEKSKHISRRFSQSVFVISAFASLFFFLFFIITQ